MDIELIRAKPVESLLVRMVKNMCFDVSPATGHNAPVQYQTIQGRSLSMMFVDEPANFGITGV
jgi:acetoacetate decarboxylase